MKLHSFAKNLLAFHCPGCGYGHHVTVNGRKNESGATWEWNGSMESPTFAGSILTFKNEPTMRCHAFVKDGNIQFLADCHHELAGQTVSIPEWEDSKPSL